MGGRPVSVIDEFMAWTPPVPPDPTEEQQAIIDLFATGDSFKVEAGAGTGKTTTLQMVADSTITRGLYLAFNKAIVVDAGKKMGRNVRCRTAHSMAYAAIGGDYRHRLDAPRMRSSDIAKLLGIKALRIDIPGHARYLAPWRLAGIVMRTIAEFCKSIDDTPGPHHVPRQEGIDWPGTGDQGQQQLAHHLRPYVRTAWADLQSLDGQLPFKHEHYLKLWQLSDPHLEYDFILFDEAQDANPVMADVVAKQAGHAQLGWIGDSQQQIYSFTGAINALAGIDASHTRMLTQSWRFGPAIATAANEVLGALNAPLRLHGAPGREGRVGHVIDDEVRCVLTRTNARAVVEVIDQLERGRKPHLLGGGKDIIDFARGAQKLRDGEKATHPDLACFDTWFEVLEYVATDALGGELALLVDLVTRFSPKRLMAILLDLPRDEAGADLVISTAHKAKGREWPTVRLAEDLDIERDDEQPGVPLEELRLLYVAVTRAQEALDPTTVQLAWPWLTEIHEQNGTTP